MYSIYGWQLLWMPNGSFTRFWSCLNVWARLRFDLRWNLPFVRDLKCSNSALCFCASWRPNHHATITSSVQNLVHASCPKSQFFEIHGARFFDFWSSETLSGEIMAVWVQYRAWEHNLVVGAKEELPQEQDNSLENRPELSAPARCFNEIWVNDGWMSSRLWD